MDLNFVDSVSSISTNLNDHNDTNHYEKNYKQEKEKVQSNEKISLYDSIELSEEYLLYEKQKQLDGIYSNLRDLIILQISSLISEQSEES